MTSKEIIAAADKIITDFKPVKWPTIDMGAKEIKLYRYPHGWNARFINAPEVVEVMGTDIIPTAFTERATAFEVQSKMEALNPGFIVSVVAM